MLTERENYIRNAKFAYPEWIPATISVSNASWDKLRYELEEVAIKYPRFFPHVKPGWRDYGNFDFGSAYTAGKKFTDEWGCIWETSVNGIEGVVKNAPLADWDKLEDYLFPDPEFQKDRGPRDWSKEKEHLFSRKEAGRLTEGGLPHGFLLLRMEYLRGFDNIMLDIAMDEPKLNLLICEIQKYNRGIIKRYVDMGVDVIDFPEDLGSQSSLIISPKSFRKWILQAYQKLFDICRERETLIRFHSDGYIMEIVDDLIKSGVDIINPQDLCNGIDNIAEAIKGRACIRLDIDRQKIIPYGTRKEIHELIEEEVRKLGSPEGGLEFIAGIYPPTPPENVDALCEALERYRRYWWE